MKTLTYEEIENMVKKQSSKRKEEESLWNICLKNAPYQNLNGLWFLSNLVLVLLFVIFYSTSLIFLIVVIFILCNGIFYENIKKWNHNRQAKTLEEKFNTSPEFFEKVMENLGAMKDSYLFKIDYLKKKIRRNGLLNWDERQYYEHELIPTWNKLLYSITSDITWCEDQRIDTMRRRDGIGPVVVIKQYSSAHLDQV